MQLGQGNCTNPFTPWRAIAAVVVLGSSEHARRWAIHQAERRGDVDRHETRRLPRAGRRRDRRTDNVVAGARSSNDSLAARRARSLSSL